MEEGRKINIVIRQMPQYRKNPYLIQVKFESCDYKL